jgi:hypothetical protein
MSPRSAFQRLKRGPRLLYAAILLVVLACILAAWISGREAHPPGGSEVAAKRADPSKPSLNAPPRVEPMLVRPLAPTDAIAINAAIPLASSPGPAARPLRVGGPGASLDNALDCLTAALYYEAASESIDGQRAVAQVVLNRVRHPAFPASVCGVVFEGSERATGCQFSFTCDGSLLRQPIPQLWARLRTIAGAALRGEVQASVGNATHYHADYVVPYWASSLVKSAVIGRHIFYRWRGYWGTPPAFRQRYAAAEKPYAELVKRDVASTPNVPLQPPPEDLNGLLTPAPLPAAPVAVPEIKEDEQPRPRLRADELSGSLLLGGERGDAREPAPTTPKAKPKDPVCPKSNSPARPAQPIGSGEGAHARRADC